MKFFDEYYDRLGNNGRLTCCCNVIFLFLGIIQMSVITKVLHFHLLDFSIFQQGVLYLPLSLVCLVVKRFGLGSTLKIGYPQVLVRACRSGSSCFSWCCFQFQQRLMSNSLFPSQPRYFHQVLLHSRN